MTAPQNRALAITEDTEIYDDLGIYGDEIVDLVWWLEKEFGVECNINPFKYAPHEFPFFWAWRLAQKVIGIRPQYKSLKVRDVVAAIEAKRWPDEASG
jgi:acyl carrier protein